MSTLRDIWIINIQYIYIYIQTILDVYIYAYISTHNNVIETVSGWDENFVIQQSV